MEELDSLKLDSLKLDTIFESIDNKNNKIKDKLNDISKLKLKIDTEHIKKLSDVSDNLNYAFEELKEIYYHMLGNDNSISKTEEELVEIKSYKIDNHIKKVFLPYMLLMKIKLENELI
mgnify:CR=1 FL=1|tara:strand:+ start:185 stop:538 length:354 start_codon:yes stop_codon:yes gene_type:complete